MTEPDRPTRVYLFATCLVDLYFPDAGMAVVELLVHHGIRVVFPQDQTCCGQPPFNAGETAMAQEMARRTVALFPEHWPVIVPSASCAAMLKLHYPKLLEGTVLADRAARLASRVYEFAEFVQTVLGLRFDDLGSPADVALHVSCSARREMGLADAHEQLLGQLAKVNTLTPCRAEECCGFGGTFAVKSPALSEAMTHDKCAAIRDTGAQVLVTADPGCLLSLKGHLDATQQPIRSQHLAEFLWQRTRAKTHHGDASE